MTVGLVFHVADPREVAPLLRRLFEAMLRGLRRHGIATAFSRPDVHLVGAGPELPAVEPVPNGRPPAAL